MTAIATLSIVGFFISSLCMNKVLSENSSKQFFYPIFIFTILIMTTYTYSLMLDYSIKSNFILALLLTFLILNYLLLILMFIKPAHHLALILLPLSAIVVFLTLVFDFKSSTDDLNYDLFLHILVSLVSYGLLGLAAIQALLLKFQEQKLKNLNNSSLSNLLPSMDVMEKIMFDLIVIGFVLLTISLLTGAPFVSSEADRILLQKITFSVIAWLAYFYLIYQRFSSNVIGKKANNLAISGMIFLLFAYLGTKVLFEYF